MGGVPDSSEGNGAIHQASQTSSQIHRLASKTSYLDPRPSPPLAASEGGAAAGSDLLGRGEAAIPNPGSDLSRAASNLTQGSSFAKPSGSMARARAQRRGSVVIGEDSYGWEGGGNEGG